MVELLALAFILLPSSFTRLFADPAPTTAGVMAVTTGSYQGITAGALFPGAQLLDGSRVMEIDLGARRFFFGNGSAVAIDLTGTANPAALISFSGTSGVVVSGSLQTSSGQFAVDGFGNAYSLGLTSGSTMLGDASAFVGAQDVYSALNPSTCVFVSSPGDTNSHKLIIQSTSYGFSQVQQGNPLDDECSWTFLTGVSQFGAPPVFTGNKTSMGLGAYGEPTSLFVFGSDLYGGPYLTGNTVTGAVYVGKGDDDGSGGMLQVDGPYEFVDDSSTPANESTPAGWIHFKRSDGSDAWFPYYQ